MRDILKETEQGLQDAASYFADRVKTVRTGRANPQLVEGIKVNYYGQDTPLGHLAAISIPEPTTIAIQPYDRNAIDDVLLALTNAKDLGLTPNSDGTTIRLSLPSLTTERRDQLIKQLHGMAEEARIALRNVREETWRRIQNQQKEGKLTEDDRERGRKELDRLIEEYNTKVAETLKAKENEVSQL